MSVTKQASQSNLAGWTNTHQSTVPQPGSQFQANHARLETGHNNEMHQGCPALVCSTSGVIALSSDSAAAMFGCRSADLEGVPLWSLLSDIPHSSAHTSFFSRYWAYLSNESKWHRFRAVDFAGRRFPVEVVVTDVSTEGVPQLLLHLRQCAEV